MRTCANKKKKMWKLQKEKCENYKKKKIWKSKYNMNYEYSKYRINIKIKNYEFHMWNYLNFTIK